MKLSPTKVKKAIIQEALNIKKRKEIYRKAKELNEELKALNEMRAFETGLGPGFANSTAPGVPGGGGGPSQVLGLAMGPMLSGEETSDDVNTVGSLSDLYNLDKEMQDTEEAGDIEASTNTSDLERENAELKEKLAQLANLAQTLSEGTNLNEEEIDELFGGLKGLGNFAKDKAQGAAGAVKGAVQKGVGQAKQAYQAGEEKAATEKKQAGIAKIAQQIKSTQSQLNQLNQKYQNLTGGKTYSGKAVHSPAEE